VTGEGEGAVDKRGECWRGRHDVSLY